MVLPPSLYSRQNRFGAECNALIIGNTAMSHPISIILINLTLFKMLFICNEHTCVFEYINLQVEITENTIKHIHLELGCVRSTDGNGDAYVNCKQLLGTYDWLGDRM